MIIALISPTHHPGTWGVWSTPVFMGNYWDMYGM